MRKPLTSSGAFYAHKEVWDQLKDQLAYDSLYEMEIDLFQKNYVYTHRCRGTITLEAVFKFWEEGIEAEQIFKLLKEQKI